jgi:hypothetical protein
MNLDGWMTLTPDERNAARAEWGRHDPILDGDELWSSILEEATRKFAIEYRRHPMINRITCGAGRILVTTALYPLQYLEDVPSRYCHFLVEQEPINGSRDYYLRYWRILFENLLGWSDAQTSEWAMRWDDDLNGRNGSMFYHEDIYYYAMPQILESSGIRTNGMIGKLKINVQDAIQKGQSWPIWGSPCDWALIRSRVNAILNEQQGKLPI